MVRSSTASTSGPAPPMVANCSIIVLVSSTVIWPRPGAFIAAVWSSRTCTWGATGMAGIVGSAGQAVPVATGGRVHVGPVARATGELDREPGAARAGQRVDGRVRHGRVGDRAG